MADASILGIGVALDQAELFQAVDEPGGRDACDLGEGRRTHSAIAPADPPAKRPPHSVLTRHLVGVSSHVAGDVVEQDQ
jgi:hypothetical protein